MDRSRRFLAFGIAVVLFSSGQSVAEAAGAGGWHGLGWDRPPLQQTQSIKGVDGGLRTPSASSEGRFSPAPVTWPAAATAEVDLPTDAAAKVLAGQSVAVARSQAQAGKADARHAAGKVRISTLDQVTAAKAGIKGVLVKAEPVGGDTSGPVTIDVDYRSFGDAYGGDFGGRLHLVQYPSCLLTTPDKPECHVGTPLKSDNNTKTQHVTADVTLPGAPAVDRQKAAAPATTSMLVAAQSDTKSGGGDFTATDLKPAGAWTAGTSSADFSYSYPISTPSAVGGTGPAVSLNYSSSAVDGLTSATNNQASGIGDGWNLSGSGFIERRYKGCGQDLGGNNNQTKTGDLCWYNDNATISFSGANGDLILDKATGKWHPKDDDGTRVERLTGGANGDKFGEYWKVTTPDGVQYFFGLNHLPGWASGKAETQSTWTVPVFGNNTDEPCNATTYAASWCNRAWRWNLDYVVDPRGNAISYYYQPETNYYGLNRNASTANNPGTSYTRGGYLQKVEYGFNTKVADTFSHAPAQILFDTAERCFPSGTITCDPGQLNSGTATSWPDVPSETICAQGAVCTYGSPSFFSRKRYTKITTQVSDGGTGWKPVREWALGQSFPPTKDGEKTALWLDSITETGKIASPNTVGSSVTLPPTTFHAKAMANRVNANTQYTALTRERIDAITNPQGGLTSVTYADPECVTGVKMPDPNSLKDNRLSCYPVYWTPPGANDPVLDYFNKFQVKLVEEDAKTTGQEQHTVTSYGYLGGAAWHYDDDPFTDPKYRTWSQWRGYGDVKTTVGLGPAAGDPSGPPVVTETYYLRGMEGATVTSDNWHESIVDRKEVAGFVRETVTYRDGAVIGGTLNEPWVSGATGTDAYGRTSAYVDTDTSRTRTWLDTSKSWRTSRTHTVYGKYGLAASVQTEGDISDPKQTSCTLTQYLENTTAWLVSFPSQAQKVSGICDGTTNPPGPGNIISDNRSYYDTQAFGAAPTSGNVTQVDTLEDWPAGGAEKLTKPATTTVYDKYGRATSSTDALGLTTTTAYTPSSGGPLTQVDTTSPPVTAAPNAPKFTSTKYLDPVSGISIAGKDGSGLRTDATQDALGRIISVWKPGHSKAQNAPADAIFTYSVRNSGGVSNVAAQTLLASGQYATSYTLYDGLGRTIQTQAPRTDDGAGRIITDTYFDSQGRAYKTHNPYWNSTSGPSATLYVTNDASVPNTTLTTFDSAGAARASAYRQNDVEQWRTTTIPDGDRTTTIPPGGGTATTTITNGLGQATQLLQYKDPAKYTTGSPADTTTYTYTRSGQQATVTDTTGKNVWSFEYDLKGRKISAKDPDTATTTFTYDVGDRLLTTTDARKRLISYTYDNLGRKTAEYDGAAVIGAKLADWTYDTLLPGQPTSSTRYIGTKAYTKETTGYDTAGRSTGSKVTIPAGDQGISGSYSFGTTYDPNSGAVRQVSSPGAGGLPLEQLSFDYYGRGAVKALTSSTGSQMVSNTSYNPFGQVLRTDFNDAASPYQVSVSNTYENGTNRLATVQAQRSTSSDFWIANRVYTYNPVGNITKIADTPPGLLADTQCFRQDYLQRLTEAWTPSSGDCATPPTTAGIDGAAPYWTSWTFDDTGNRKTQVQHTTAGAITTSSTYPEAGQPRPHAVQAATTNGPNGTTQTNYGYTDTGSTETRGPTGSAQTFTYDAEGHVATAKEANGGTSSYLYDADGNLLITKDPSGTTLSIGDIELFVPTGGIFASGTRFYGYNGQVIATRTRSGGVSWKLADHHGTSYATVDAANLTVSKRWQDPYGTTRGTPPSTWPDKHGFLGGYQNTTGVTHIGARDYDPLTGRFMTADPVLDTSNPQALNAYSYGNNSPVSFSDPTGMVLQIDGRPAYIGSAAISSMSPAGKDRANRYNAAVGRNWIIASIKAPAYPAWVGKDTHLVSPKVRRGIWETKFANWSLQPPEQRPPDFDQFEAAFCFENPDVRACDHSPPSLEETAEVVALLIPWGAVFRVGGEVAGGFIAALEGSVSAGGAVAGGVGINALADLGGAATAAKIAAGAARGEGAAASCMNSFTSDTPVLMADGTRKPIAEVKVGDEVRNAEPDDTFTEHHVVTALHVTDEDHDFVDVEVGTPDGPRTVVTTAHHPFWNSTTHAWTDASDLKIDDQLTTPGGGRVAVRAVHLFIADNRTYNLTVNTVHTYYVFAGDAPVLVHNCGPSVPWVTGKLPVVEESALGDTLANIDAGTVPGGATARRWGIQFRNRDGDLPGAQGDASPYREYRVSPPSGVRGAGPLRVVRNSDTGATYYTWTHYGDSGDPAFVRIR